MSKPCDFIFRDCQRKYIKFKTLLVPNFLFSTCKQSFVVHFISFLADEFCFFFEQGKSHKMAICSRNMSMCCAALSAWGVIQLVVMGFLFYNHAVAFAEDLQLEVEGDNEPVNMDAFYKMADQKYTYTVSAESVILIK